MALIYNRLKLSSSCFRRTSEPSSTFYIHRLQLDLWFLRVRWFWCFMIQTKAQAEHTYWIQLSRSRVLRFIFKCIFTHEGWMISAEHAEWWIITLTDVFCKGKTQLASRFNFDFKKTQLVWLVKGCLWQILHNRRFIQSQHDKNQISDFNRLFFGLKKEQIQFNSSLNRAELDAICPTYSQSTSRYSHKKQRYFKSM